MNRTGSTVSLLAIAVATCVLGGFGSAARAVGYGVDSLGVAIDSRLAGLPVPPADDAEKALQKALVSAKATIGKAASSQTLAAAAKAMAKIDAAFSRGVPAGDELSLQFDSVVGNFSYYLDVATDDLGPDVALLPEGASRTALEGMVLEARGQIDAGFPGDRKATIRALGVTAKLLDSARGKLAKAVTRAVGKSPFTATVDGERFVADTVNAAISWELPALHVLHITASREGAGGTETIGIWVYDFGIGAAGGPPAGVHSIDGQTTGYFSSSAKGSLTSAGTITILATSVGVEPSSGKATGLFSFTGDAFPSGTISVQGSFNLEGIALN